jgi:predicted glycogen debranching enzyme
MIRFGRDVCGDLPAATRREWLETNGLGGSASSTIIGLNTRRYHALLIAATTPPVGRFVLLSKLEETLIIDGRRYDLSANQYPGVVHPQGYRYLSEFRLDPFPVFQYTVDGVEIVKSVFLTHGENGVVVQYVMRGAAPARLEVRPLIAFRDYHSTTHENGALDARVVVEPGRASMAPYQGLPTLHLAHDAGAIDTAGCWYRHFEYAEERERGLDFVEDLFNPFTLSFSLDASRRTATIIASTQRHDATEAASLRRGEIARRAAVVAAVPNRADAAPLVSAGDQYVVARGAHQTIIAGYPWFSDWGRDTFIALRGLCLATGRLGMARDILLAWAAPVSEGMLPNRFPDQGDTPEFNSVDASLWYIVAVHDYLAALREMQGDVPADDLARLQAAVEGILAGYAAGTRFGIRLASDGLLAAGQAGVQLTWMDAKVGDWVVTPRIGKPVEVQALWLNALHIGSAFSQRWQEVLERGRVAFEKRFWNVSGGYLYDVVDVDHHAGAVDASFRPNQIFAVGGLPLLLLDPDRARRVVETVEGRLLTPLGLRSLAPGEPGYVPHYHGGVRERDGAYHQGTVWPWLMGPFVEAWVRIRGNTTQAKQEARARFLEPLLAHLSDAGLGHISEIADGDAPHTPAGCPFQAWSVGELLRLELTVLGPAVGTFSMVRSPLGRCGLPSPTGS